MNEMLSVAHERRRTLGNGDTIVKIHMFPDSSECQGVQGTGQYETMNDDGVIEARLLKDGSKFGYQYMTEGLTQRHGFAILLSRRVDAGNPGDSLVAEFFPLDFAPVLSPIKAAKISEFKDYGLNWTPVDQRIPDVPAHAHVMELPLDSWDIDSHPFPPISIRVERMLFDEDGSFVDVLDIIIRPKESSKNPFRTLHALSR